MAAEATPKLPKGRGLWDNRILQYHRHMEALEESEAGTYLLARRSGGKMMAASRVRREWKVSLQLHRINQKCLSHRDVVASPST